MAGLGPPAVAGVLRGWSVAGCCSYILAIPNPDSEAASLGTVGTSWRVRGARARAHGRRRDRGRGTPWPVRGWLLLIYRGVTKVRTICTCLRHASIGPPSPPIDS